MSWLTLNDDQLSAAQLEALVAQRAADRRGQTPPLALDEPEFEIAKFPLHPQLAERAPHLYFHLKQLNNFPPPPDQVDLADSPATQLPVIGPLWRRMRGALHNVVIFYVARLVRHETEHNNELLHVVNELTRLTIQQQQEIEQLAQRLSDE